MFHPVNAILLLGLSGYLARRAWGDSAGRRADTRGGGGVLIDATLKRHRKS